MTSIRPFQKLKMIPEFDLLLDAVQACGQELKNQLDPVKNDSFNWDLFVDLVCKHCVINLVTNTVQQVSPWDIPSKTVTNLRQISFSNAMRMLNLTGELAHLQKQASAIKLRIITLKGPPLAIKIYEDPGLRPSADLDLFISTDDIDDAVKFLNDNGYDLADDEIQFISMEKTLFYRQSKHLGFFNKEKDIKVELHWRFFVNARLFPLNFDTCWSSRQNIVVSNVEVSILSDQYLILYLCVHGAVHFWKRLNWLCDVVGAIRNFSDRDWLELDSAAIEMGTHRPLYQGLILAHLLFNQEIPSRILQEYDSDLAINFLVNSALQVILNTVEDNIIAPVAVGQISKCKHWWNCQRYFMSLRGEISYKWDQLTWLMGPTDRDIQLLPLPESFFLLYYPLKPFLYMFNRLRRTHRS